MKAEIVPLTLEEARRYVAEHHRHNEPPLNHRFSIGLEIDHILAGVVIAGRPVARSFDDGRTLELYRVTTEGGKNACSMLYGAACRAAHAMGFRRVITYTLGEEPGTSLLAAGFTIDQVRDRKVGDWQSRDGRGITRLRLFDPPKMPDGPKVRWIRQWAA